MLSSDELEKLTREERAAWTASNQTEKLFKATAMKRVAYQRAIEKGVSLNGKPAAEREEEFQKMSSG